MKRPGFLARKTSGRIEEPERVLLAGVEGIGKSTFGAQAPKPIFLGTERGTGRLDVDRLPEASSWGDVLAMIEELTVEPHDYETLVIDTVDWLEPLVWAHVCTAEKKRSIEDLGFGKGYTKALEHWRLLISKLGELQDKRRMHIVALAHTWVRTFKNPTGEDFDRYTLRLHDKAGGLFKEWADAVFFAEHETHTYTSNDRTKGIATGARIIHTERAAGWDAKNRHGLPPTMPLDFATVWSAMRAGHDIDALNKRIDAALESVADDIRDKANAWREKHQNDGPGLAQLLNRITQQQQATS